MRICLSLLLATLLAACAQGRPGHGEQLSFESRSLAFMDQLESPETHRQQTARGWLFLPQAEGPHPAVVILHSASGQGAQDWFYAELLNSWGYAALAIDAFGPRGVDKTIFDQTAVSELSIAADALAGLKLLAQRADIDADRIAVLGFSKGGLPALLTGLKEVQSAFEASDFFAAHIAFYPWCGVRPATPETSKSPWLVLSGEDDQVTPPTLCPELFAQVRTINPGQDITFVTYPGAKHAFDHPHPGLKLLKELPVRGNLPRACVFEEQEDGSWIERSAGTAVTSETLFEALMPCSAPGAKVARDEVATADARSRLRAVLDAMGGED